MNPANWPPRVQTVPTYTFEICIDLFPETQQPQPFPTGNFRTPYEDAFDGALKAMGIWKREFEKLSGQGDMTISCKAERK